MSTAMTLSDLMIAVRQRADMLSSGYTPSLVNTASFVTDPELISYLNQSAFELYDILVEAMGEDYFVASPVTLTTDGVSETFALPNGTNFSSAPALYKLLGVDLQVSSGQYQSLKPFQFSERNRIRRTGLPAYRISGGNLMLEPLAPSGVTLRLWYVPRLSPMAALSDTLDGVSGWTEYVITDAAIRCAQKEESDVSILMAQKKALYVRIQAAAENRDTGEPFTVADTLNYGRGAFDTDDLGPFSITSNSESADGGTF